MIDENGQVPAQVLNQQRLAEGRAELIASAGELFIRQGFHKTSIREIAEAAGWTMGRIYHYISCKEDILYLLTYQIIHEYLQSLETLAPAPTAEETLRQAIRRMFLNSDGMHREIRLVYRESASLPPHHLHAIQQMELKPRALLASIVERGISDGEFRPVDANLVAHTILALGSSWTLKHWVLRDITDFETYLRTESDLLFSYLLPSRHDTPAESTRFEADDTTALLR